MIPLGKKSQIVGAESWPVIRIYKRPRRYPRILPGYEVACGLENGAGESMFVCETLRDMQTLYSEHLASGTIGISWYQKPESPRAAVA